MSVIRGLSLVLTDSCRSHISAISEVITGRVEDTCPEDSSDSNGQAKADMGIAKMDIFRSEIACECRRETFHAVAGADGSALGRLRRCVRVVLVCLLLLRLC